MKTKKENVPLLFFLSITYAVVCFVVLWIPLRFFAGCTQKIAEIEQNAAEKPHLTEAERFAVAEQYIYEKYGVECVAVQDHDGTNVNWEWVDPVVMRLKDDPNGEMLKELPAQAFLDNENSKKRCNDGKPYCDDGEPYFLVYLDDYYEVIGDQYMWYQVYPLLDAWMQAHLDALAPAPTHIEKIYWCYSYGVNAKRNEWSFPYSFAPDFQIVTDISDLEEQLPHLHLYLVLSAPEWCWWGDNTRPDWYPFEQKMGEYEFGSLRMSINVRTSAEDATVKNLALYRRDAQGEVIPNQEE